MWTRMRFIALVALGMALGGALMWSAYRFRLRSALQAAVSPTPTSSPLVTSTALPGATTLTPPTAIPSVVEGIHGALRVDAANGRYFTDDTGRAIYLTGSHTWDNRQERDADQSHDRPFDFTRYLDFLQARHHNFIRLWAWEQAAWAPWTTGKVQMSPLPYSRSTVCCALDGGPKFDLSHFNQAYFDRLRSRVVAARDRGVYVSVMLFEGWSIGKKAGQPGNPWPGHPINAANNINGVNGDPNGTGDGEDTHTLHIPAIVALQEAYVRKVIDTVGDLDNVLYEISNEDNWSPGNTTWQYAMIDYIHAYEARQGMRRPVGMTVQIPPPGSSGVAPLNAVVLTSPADWVSPNAVGGYDTDPPMATGAKVVLADTDHIFGVGGDSALVWKTFTRGNNVLYMDPYGDPGNPPANESTRQAMGQTLTYARTMDLIHMTPRGDLTSTGYALAKLGAEYLVYQPAGGAFSLDLTDAPGRFAVEWFNPATDAVTAGAPLTGGNTATLTAPFSGPSVLYLRHV